VQSKKNPYGRLARAFATVFAFFFFAPLTMRYSVSHQKLQMLLSAQGLTSGDAAGIDKLCGGADGYYWYGTLRDMCPPGKTLIWEDQYAMVKAIQAHENATAAEDEMPAQVPTAAHIAAISKLLGNPL
jgi:hypothetical protein